MTEEELADKYAEEYFGKKTEWVEVWKLKSCKENFLAGLKAGRPQWHDLWKDKNDLPERLSFLSKTVINQIGTPCHYNYALECWQNWSNTEIETPVAWCELPTFDKEIEK